MKTLPVLSRITTLFLLSLLLTPGARAGDRLPAMALDSQDPLWQAAMQRGLDPAAVTPLPARVPMLNVPEAEQAATIEFLRHRTGRLLRAPLPRPEWQTDGAGFTHSRPIPADSSQADVEGAYDEGLLSLETRFWMLPDPVGSGVD